MMLPMSSCSTLLRRCAAELAGVCVCHHLGRTNAPYQVGASVFAADGVVSAANAHSCGTLWLSARKIHSKSANAEKSVNATRLAVVRSDYA